VAEINVVSLGAGAFRVSTGTRNRIAYVAGPSSARWVFLDGRVYVVDQSQRGRVKKRRHEDIGMAAPMPATVVAVNVEPGQRVTKGDLLVMLEAMKMELPVKAPRDAVVRAIACRPGELVQPGMPLLELE
jgi:biotin carboxyl carrier protein